MNTLTFTDTVGSTADRQYKVQTTSTKGVGAFSVRTTFILASTPTITSAPVKVSASKNTITVSWTLTSNGGSPVLGYMLYQTNVTTGGTFLIYDGSSIPTVTSYTITGLTPGNLYQYSVKGINRIGVGALSPASVSILASDVPGKPNAPYYLASTSTTITLGWIDTGVNGGSLISQYNIYSDTGVLTSAFTMIASTPTLTYIVDKALITAITMNTGTLYRFYITAVNAIGESVPSN